MELPVVNTVDQNISTLPIQLTREDFLVNLIRELSGSLQDIVGLDEASGFISLVGQKMGQRINEEYRNRLQLEKLDARQVAEVCADLKCRIGGDFYIISQDEEQIILGNRKCPFGDKVRGRQSLCQMTTNVFGYIAADNLGYARVELCETMAEGSDGCKVQIHLQSSESVSATAREYFGE